MKRFQTAKWHLWAIAAIPVVAFVAIGSHLGIPELRHDWGIPATATGWHAFVTDLTSGWGTTGIGVSRPYPTLYLIAPILAAIALSLGSVAALSVFLAAIAAAYLYAGIRIGEVFASRWIGLAIGTALLFSPWNYEKLVAGHLVMMLAAAMCGVIVGESAADRPRPAVLLLCAYVAAFQIQFAFFAILLSTVGRWSLRAIGATTLGAVLSLLPSIVGILLSVRTLSSIPYTLAWQFNNSVPFGKALLLDGYAPHYTSGAGEPALIIGAGALASLALLGLIANLTRPQVRGVALRGAVVCLLLILYASGSRGPIAPFYLFSLHFRPLLVFRELFDLLGAAAVCYALLAVLAVRAIPSLRFALPPVAAALFVAWIVTPPWHWWVASSSVPRPNINTNIPNVRFALIPWQQPMQFYGAGAGADPDLYLHAHNVAPLNEYSPSYPGDVALSQYVHLGRVKPLEALSVSHVYFRPYLKTDSVTLGIAIPRTRSPRADRPRATRLTARSELSLISPPANSDVPKSFAQNYLFDGGSESRMNADLQSVRIPDVSSNAASAWIDASLIFSQYPEVGNAIGGAFTISRRAALAVPSPAPMAALVFVRGTLRGKQGTRTHRQGWQWFRLDGSRRLTCRGECLVAAWQRHSVLPSSRPATRTTTPLRVPFRAVLPYVLIGNVPQHPKDRTLLLLRDRYANSWALFGIPNKHLVVSMIFNGFLLPTKASGSFVLIETTALTQAIAMLASVLGIILALLYLTRTTTRSTPRTEGPL